MVLTSDTPIMGAEECRVAETLSLERSRPPTVVPGYEPERFLGKGAFGEVWVFRAQNTGRRVAVKFYSHRGGLDWSLLTREVEKLAFLFNDRHIVQLLEVGWEADPPYFIMEYLERGSLEERLADGPLSIPEALTIFRDVAKGLLSAHGKGVLHCDLKPANVLLDSDWTPRLADFGQSRLSHEQTPALGTLFYMAPEQADPVAIPDARWDVYALGAMLYRMLTGSPPYKSTATAHTLERSATLAERLIAYRKILRESPKPRDHLRVPDMDRALAEVIERCLAIDPKKRFPNPQSVLSALDQREQAMRRRPIVLLGVFGPLLFLVIAFAVGVWTFRNAISRSTTAVIDRTEESSRFAAQFVSETVARQIDRRWRVLEQEARDPDLRVLLAEEQDVADELHPELQQWIEIRYREYSAHASGEQGVIAPALSWFVTNARGVQVARFPASDLTRNRYFGWRDYFHGQGRDFTPETKGLPPIRVPHLSVVFESAANRAARTASFSVPIWSKRPGTPDAEILGVLAMTVEMGDFGELTATPTSEEHPSQFAVLVDLRGDHLESERRRGLILQHPRLAELRREFPNRALPIYRVPPAVLELLDALQVEAGAGQPLPEDLATMEDYRDIVGGAYEGRWIASGAPVVIEGRPRELATPGWAVIVQERYDDVVSPVIELRQTLRNQGIVGLAGLLAVQALLLLLVALALIGRKRIHIWDAFRRRMGLPLDASSSLTRSGATDGSSRSIPTGSERDTNPIIKDDSQP